MKKDVLYIFILLVAFVGLKHLHKPVFKMDSGLQQDQEVVEKIQIQRSVQKKPEQTNIIIRKIQIVQTQAEEVSNKGDHKTDLKTKYPQIKENLFRVPMTEEIWEARIQRMPAELRKVVEMAGVMPATAILTPDDEPIVSSLDLKPTSDCSALNETNEAITVSINEKGQVQDAVYNDPGKQDPIPEGIYSCTFQPYVFQGAISPVMTALSSTSKLKMVSK